ncbi:hypothetical protein EJB05_27492, partial [Eragrostis curvula]
MASWTRKEKYVELMLPKFKIAFRWGQLGDALRQLGLSLPLAGDGRPECRVRRGGVNELGTEAAAVTMSMLYGAGRPLPEKVEFIVDHPFTFFIMEEWYGVRVFVAGHVLDPTEG